jgi:glycosyltransferase involved in cell wall biosynthesis
LHDDGDLIPVRIAVLNDIAAQHGGGTTVAEACVTALADRGHDVIYVTGEAGPRALPVPHIDLGLVDIRQRRDVGRIAAAVWNPAAAAGVERALAAFDPADSVILLHQWTRIFSPSVFSVLRRFRTLVWAHNYFLGCPNGAYYHFGKRQPCQLQPLSLACTGSGCDAEGAAQHLLRDVRTRIQGRQLDRMKWLEIVCVSDGQLQRYGNLFPAGARRHVLDNPATITHVPTVARRGLLYVGRLTVEKGVIELAAAAAGAGLALHVVGDGPAAAAMRTAHPAATFEAWAPPEIVRQRMAAATALVMPSLWPETSGLVAFEALGQGTPVLVSNRACIADWLVNAELGLACDPGDPIALRAMLGAVGRHPRWRAIEIAATRFAADSDMRSQAFGNDLERIVLG